MATLAGQSPLLAVQRNSYFQVQMQSGNRINLPRIIQFLNKAKIKIQMQIGQNQFQKVEYMYRQNSQCKLMISLKLKN